MALKRILYDRCWAYLAALCLALPLTANADFATCDAININISNGDAYAIAGDGTSYISTLAGDMPDNAWQNTPSGNAVVSGDARNGSITGVTAYDAASKASTTLSDVVFAWAVEGSLVQNYGYAELAGYPTFQKSWLARYSTVTETSAILVQSIPYRKYDVIVYCSGADDTAFSAIAINGVSYVGDTSLETETKTKYADSASDTWGSRSANPTLGQNAIRVNGIENPELSIVIAGGATSVCAVQILRDMEYGIGPTTKKTISINIQSAYTAIGTKPAVFGLEPVPLAAWTQDGLSSANSTGTDVSASIMEWNGSEVVEATGVTVNEKANNSWGNSTAQYRWPGHTYTPHNNILSSYLDDGGDRARVAVANIPYELYDVIVYMATDTADYHFGPVQVNGTPYRWDESSATAVKASSADSSEETRWGASRSRVPAYGLNVLRIPNQTGPTLTVVGANNQNSARGGIAAIQIVEAEFQPDENNLQIDLNGDMTYPVGETKTLTGTVYITGSGTLTLGGTEKITATNIYVGKDVVLNLDFERLDATSYTGRGTVVYNGTQPTDKGWSDSAWTGTVWVKNLGNGTLQNLGGATSNNASANPVNKWGNASSFVKFTNVYGYMDAASCPWTLILEDDGENYAWYNNNGWSGRDVTIAGLKGTGTFYDVGNKKCRQDIIFTNVKMFSGTIRAEGKRVGLGGKSAVTGDSETLAGVIEVIAGNSVDLASGKSWYAGYRIAVNGTLNNAGTLNSGNTSSAISGSGTIVFVEQAPSPTGDAWWKNANWTGTVEIKDCATSFGNFHLTTYGNGESKVCLNGATGNLFSTYSSGAHGINELIIGAGGFTQAGNYSMDNTFIVPCKVSGSGKYTISTAGTGVKTINFAGDMSEFSGMLTFDGAQKARVLIGGSTNRSLAENSIVIASNATFTVGSDWSSAKIGGGICVDKGANLTVGTGGYIDIGGEVTIDGAVSATGRAIALGCFGTNTVLRVNDSGVLTFTSSGNRNDSSNSTDLAPADYSGIIGTGTLVLSSSSGWRTFPYEDERMPATTLTIQIELAGALIITKDNNGETIIGNLAGSKNIRSDWSPSGNTEAHHPRTLTVTQSKDTEWQGKFVSNRITKFKVTGSGGTLTLSGAQTESIPAQIEAGGAVNLTGTWNGATTVGGTMNLTGTLNGNATVAGTIGGTGTLTGDLTFADGAVFKAFATDADGLKVTGSVTVPDNVKVKVDISDILSELELDSVRLITANGCESSKFTLDSEYLAQGYQVVALKDAVYVQKGDPSGGSDDLLLVYATNVAHTVVSITFAGTTYTSTKLLDSGYWVFELPFDEIDDNSGAMLTVEYTSEDGYVIVGKTTYELPPTDELCIDVTLDSKYGSETDDDVEVFDTEGKGLDELADTVAFVTSSAGVNTMFESLDEAFNSVKAGETVTLITNANLSAAYTVTNTLTIAGVTNCVMGGSLMLDATTLTLSDDRVKMENPIHVLSIDAKLVFPTNSAPKVTCEPGFSPKTETVGANTIMTFAESGFDTWAAENKVEGAWNDSTDGIPNVFRYVFNKPSEDFLVISGIVRNADGSVTITTPPVVKTDGFNVYIVASEDLALDDGDSKIEPTDAAKTDGIWEILPAELSARFFCLGATED